MFLFHDLYTLIREPSVTRLGRELLHLDRLKIHCLAMTSQNTDRQADRQAGRWCGLGSREQHHSKQGQLTAISSSAFSSSQQLPASVSTSGGSPDDIPVPGAHRVRCQCKYVALYQEICRRGAHTSLPAAMMVLGWLPDIAQADDQCRHGLPGMARPSRTPSRPEACVTCSSGLPSS